jgi:mannose-6-phosphate isomerase-like protein (cupin superfamily)
LEIDNNPGLTFYELYMTEGVPRLTGLEPDPMLKGTKAFPGPGGTMFRLISYPPKRPEGWKPPPGATFETGLRELSEKVAGMGDYFDRSAPGMHTSDTIDYAIVVRGEMTLELDDGQKVHLRQGDCVVQNGTRHRWRNPLPEPCLMAFVSIGGTRG